MARSSAALSGRRGGSSVNASGSGCLYPPSRRPACKFYFRFRCKKKKPRFFHTKHKHRSLAPPPTKTRLFPQTPPLYVIQLPSRIGKVSDGAGSLFWNADAPDLKRFREAAARASERNGRAWRREAGTGSPMFKNPLPILFPFPEALLLSPGPALLLLQPPRGPHA